VTGLFFEGWVVACDMQTLLVALIAFVANDKEGGIGHIRASDEERRALAREGRN
jgi:hypothetical protein